MYCSTNNMQIAANQSIIIFLYFAFSCPVEEIIILIPTYTSTDSKPTNATNLKALYHLDMLFCNSFDVDFTIFVVPSAFLTVVILPLGSFL